MTSTPRQRPLRTTVRATRVFWAIAIAGIAVWLAIAFFRVRQIPFDRQQWLNVRAAPQLSIRYRMVDDLVVRLRSAPVLTVADAQQLLGHPDLGAADSQILGYVLGNKYYGPVPCGGYYLRLAFDEDDSLVAVSVVPE